MSDENLFKVRWFPRPKSVTEPEAAVIVAFVANYPADNVEQWKDALSFLCQKMGIINRAVFDAKWSAELDAALNADELVAMGVVDK